MNRRSLSLFARNHRKKLIAAAIVVSLVAATVGALATYWTEFQWFDHLGFGSVFLTQLGAKLATGVAFGFLALAFLLVHVSLIKRFSKPRRDWTIPTPEGDIDIKELVSKVSTPVVVSAAIVASVTLGLWASRHWESVLRFLHPSSFGHSDPILSKDIGFYLFSLPAIQFTQQWLIYLSAVGVFLPAAVYLLRGEIVIENGWPEVKDKVRAHLLTSVCVVLLLIAWGYRIEMFETLFSKRGVAYGATYTDVNANLIAYKIMIGACFVACCFLLLSLFRKWSRARNAILYPGISLLLVVVLYGICTFVWPTVVQGIIVNPNELGKEEPYLVHAINFTRKAYGLDKVKALEFPADAKVDAEDLEANRPTIDNVKIWDHGPLRATYQQLQVIRLYYDFPNISVDRYRIGDKYWQVMLSARELVHSQLPDQSQTWVNKHLQYTHGYGACLSPVNQSTGEGLPNLWVKDIPPEARHSELSIERPEIYYGLATNDYVLVKTTEKEFDYPKGKENRYTTYAGKGGVRIGGLFRRLLFAARFSDTNLLFTGSLKDESRILFNRHVQERIRTLAPFLMLDQEPYITIIDGRLVWIQDAYTISYRYPYSQPTSLGRRRRVNYIRNSVKAIVDAYDGSVRFYIWDEKDPMIQTYRKIFPSLFLSKKKAGKGLIEHVRYPKDLFTIQALMYESFHMTTPRVWYNQEDKWNIARELDEKTNRRISGELSGAGARRPFQGFLGGQEKRIDAREITRRSQMAPYYMIMKLPKEEREEFLLMLPFTPKNKDNMVAWMTARCDGEDYGKILVYTFPKKKLVFGPMQVEARIDQDNHISQWITLRNQQGSAVIRGDLLVIPIEESILYIEPIYLQATQTKLPELKQVIVAFGQRVEMRPTLSEALRAVFGVRAPEPGKLKKEGEAELRGVSGKEVNEGEIGKLAAKARRLYKEARTELRKGNWARYGELQEELSQILELLSEKLGPQIDAQAPKGGK